MERELEAEGLWTGRSGVMELARDVVEPDRVDPLVDSPGVCRLVDVPCVDEAVERRLVWADGVDDPRPEVVCADAESG